MEYIIPEFVTIDNFLSIEHAEFSYQDRGLVLVDGPTGSGKSGLFVEPLCWGLFGQSMRDIGADEVINRFVGKDCHVGIVLSSAWYNKETEKFEPDPSGFKAVIDSYRKHSQYRDSLTFKIYRGDKLIDDRTGNRIEQTRAEIVKYLDMDYTAFTNSVIFSQSIAKYFSGLTDAKQKEIVERLLGIGWIPNVYDVAKSDVSTNQAKLEMALKEYETTTNALKDAGIERIRTKSNYDSFEDEKQTRIDGFYREIDKLETKNLVGIETLIAESENALEELDLKLAARTADKELNAINLEIGEAKGKRDVARKEADKWQMKLKSLESLTETECDRCGQPIGDEAKDKYAKKLIIDATKANKEFEKCNDAWNSLLEQSGEIARKKKAEDGLETEKFLLEKELKRIKKDYEDARLENAKMDEKKKSLLSQIETVRKEQNVYKPLLDSIDRQICDLENQKRRLETSYTTLSDELEYHKFWEVGYSNKGLKSLLMDSVIPRMNRSAYNYSKIFGDIFSIGFDTQSSTKKGDIREKFAVKIDNKAGSSTYYGNSEGEKRTIDTIVMFVLGDLAAERSSKRFSILVLDDVFEKLDEELCSSVINVLAAMTTPNSVLMPDENSADEYIKMLAKLPKRDSIFVLTHLEYFKSKFENRLRVGKLNGKTRIW